MNKNEDYKWPPPEWLKEPEKQIAFFHDEEVKVYEGYLRIEDIKLWRDNDRTTLDLQHLLQNSGKKQLIELSDGEIIEYILEQGLHKIEDLASSIRKNGVRVPLILSYDKELMDGNRRFLACHYLLRHEKMKNDKFCIVPVRCLPPKINEGLKLKIISEMNFLPDFKENWPQEVRAKFAIDLFKRFNNEFQDREKAYDEVNRYLKINKTTVIRFQNVLTMIDDYIAHSQNRAKQAAERFAREKFHWFEELHNKAFSGKRAILDKEVAGQARDNFFKFISDEQLDSTNKVRDFAEMIRYPNILKYLNKPDGNFERARSMYYDISMPKKISTKIIDFCEYLENLSPKEKEGISKELKDRLKSLITLL